MTEPLGNRASLLLGMLQTPQTSEELLRLIDASPASPDVVEIAERISDRMVPSMAGRREGMVTLQHLSDGGVAELDQLLERLRELGFVDRVDLGEVTMWSRKPLAA